MGIYIKGMGMPKSGYVDVRLFADGRATTATGEDPFYKIMPLIELPPHGDLIDKKTVSENLVSVLNKKNPPFSYPDWNDAIGAIYITPTIIEAENV